jgi:hypothetical protein
MNIRLVLISMLVSLLACASRTAAPTVVPTADPCSDELMQRALASTIVNNTGNPDTNETIQRVGEYDFRLTLKFAAQDENTPIAWEFTERNAGCVLTAVAEVNGQLVGGLSFYVDVEKNRVFPDNDSARGIIRILTSEPIILASSP